MDVIDEITTKMRKKLINEGGFIPFDKLGQEQVSNDNIDVDEWREFIRKSGLPLEDYYYLDWNRTCPIVYYSGLVYINPYLVLDDFAREVEQYSTQCREKLESGDFDILLTCLVDKRICIDILLEMEEEIPQNECYDIFLSVYTRMEYGFDHIDEDIISRFCGYRTGELAIPGLDQQKYVDLYRGLGSKSRWLDEAYSWTLNPAVAVYFAQRFSLEDEYGEVYRICVHKDKIKAFIPHRNEDEVLILPTEIENELEEAEEIEYITLEEINELLEDSGYHRLFKVYCEFIKEDNFEKPSDLHGIEHTKRVLYLIFCLMYLLDLEATDSTILIEAAIYHDIGRNNDGVDSEHGKKGFSLATKKGFTTTLSIQDKELLRFIIENHCIDDDEGVMRIHLYNLDDSERALRLLYIFKDADGLDRVRIHDLDANKLRYDESRRLLLVAWELFPIFK